MASRRLRIAWIRASRAFGSGPAQGSAAWRPLARRLRRLAAEFAPLSGDHQPDGKSAAGGAQKNVKRERWRDGQIVERWVAGACLLTDKNFRKRQAYRDLRKSGCEQIASPTERTNSSPRSGAGTAAVTDSKGRPVSRGVTDDAELLLTRCGAPPKDDSSEHDDPRPPIPSRVVEYQRYKLRFIFIPGAGRLGDPPPYKWRLVGITDMKAADASKARVVSPTEAANRMHCWTGN